MPIPSLTLTEHFNPENYTKVIYLEEWGTPDGDGSKDRPYRSFKDFPLLPETETVLVFVGIGEYEASWNLSKSPKVAVIGQGISNTTIYATDQLLSGGWGYYDYSVRKGQACFCDFTFQDRKGSGWGSDPFKIWQDTYFQNILFDGPFDSNNGFLRIKTYDLQSSFPVNSLNFKNCFYPYNNSKFFKNEDTGKLNVENCWGPFNAPAEAFGINENNRFQGSFSSLDSTQKQQEMQNSKLMENIGNTFGFSVNWLENERPRDLIVSVHEAGNYKIILNDFVLQRPANANEEIIIPKAYLKRGENKLTINEKHIYIYVGPAVGKTLFLECLNHSFHRVLTQNESGLKYLRFLRNSRDINRTICTFSSMGVMATLNAAEIGKLVVPQGYKYLLNIGAGFYTLDENHNLKKVSGLQDIKAVGVATLDAVKWNEVVKLGKTVSVYGYRTSPIYTLQENTITANQPILLRLLNIVEVR